MAVVVTPEYAKPIPDFSPATFDGNSILFQVRNGDDTRVDGDQVANYVATQKTYVALDNKTLIAAISSLVCVERTGKLRAGETNLIFTDAAILTTSDINILTEPVIHYVDAVQSNGRLEIEFPEQEEDIDVKIKIN